VAGLSLNRYVSDSQLSTDAEPLARTPAATYPQRAQNHDYVPRHIIVADHGGHGAEGPHRALQAGDQGFEGLARRQRDVRPPTEAEHPLEQQVRERLALDRDAQIAGVGEVECAFTARDRRLLEVRLLVRPVLRAPVPHPPLQGPQLAGLKAARIPVAQPLEQRQGLQPPVLVRGQPRHDIRRPDLGEGVRTGPPRPGRCARRRQRTVLPPPRRPLAHAGRCRGRR